MAASDYIVHLIESPRDTDILEGRQELESLRHVLKQAGIKTHDYPVVNVKCLATALRQIADSYEKGKIPVIHLSAHGNKDGIGLTSGEQILWDTMGTVFKKVNAALDGGLLLGMSTCSGFAAARMVVNRDDAPFHTLVGPTSSVDWQDALMAFMTFYHLVLTKGLEPKAASAAMNTAAGLAPDTFLVVTSEHVRDFHVRRERQQQVARIRAAAEALGLSGK